MPGVVTMLLVLSHVGLITENRPHLTIYQMTISRLLDYQAIIGVRVSATAYCCSARLQAGSASPILASVTHKK